ncbi:ecotin [Chryseobacterium viscerum]|uniref:Ecotin n=1 Tax=Chryseobacterium viscerum TaxID=1037377 RepID=A0A316WJ15_9FLAO|nr:ecotin [Chryseobacterium viscerum]PWN60433.1 ecotin [Chryseobacterium viscerum]
MKNKKLEELSKKITQGKIKKLEKYEFLTIYAGKGGSKDLCFESTDCGLLCGPLICSANECWSYS